MLAFIGVCSITVFAKTCMAIPIMNPLSWFMIMGEQITTIFPRKVKKTHYA